MSELTQILKSASEGDPKAANELLPLVYESLRKLAGAKMANEKPGHTLQPTALVHEAYVRLLGNEAIEWESRAQFFAAAAEAMRRILIDRARKKFAVKRGEGVGHVSIDEIDIAANAEDPAILLVDEALEKLERHEPECAQLVKLRFFAGLSAKEAAETLGMSERSAGRAWAYARSWLYDEMRREL